jgi:glycosyltransferase involved in cell wall biosynthesis
MSGLMNNNDNTIRVAQLQYSTESGGSAALRLQNAFLKSGIDSSIISLISDDVSGIDKTIYLGKRAGLMGKIDGRLQAYITQKKLKEFGLFSYPLLGTDVSNLEEIKQADYIYIHWALNGFLNLHSIKKLAKLNKPIIIFLHDMWAITGGCHYSFDCEKYKSGCNSCQMFVTTKKNDLAAKGFAKKLKLYSKFRNLYFVAPSKWLYDCAKASFLTKDKPIFYIPNLLDTSVFKPFNKSTAKSALNIGVNEKVIAFGAVSIDSPYKGWAYVQKALEILKDDPAYSNVTVLIFGSGYNKKIADAIPFKTNFLGYLSDKYSTSLVYNAADVFIAPSVVEAFGYVIMESLYCGTPVVAFGVGGIPDMIKHKENGYIAKYKDANDVSDGIKFCFQNNTKGAISSEFDPLITVQRHLKLFDYIKNLKSS